MTVVYKDEYKIFFLNVISAFWTLCNWSFLLLFTATNLKANRFLCCTLTNGDDVVVQVFLFLKERISRKFMIRCESLWNIELWKWKTRKQVMTGIFLKNFLQAKCFSCFHWHRTFHKGHFWTLSCHLYLNYCHCCQNNYFKANVFSCVTSATFLA